MGLKTVAEYVENAETLAIIRELGIDYAQGYAVGGLRPLTAGMD
jgi:EAL domain-containing protein (putative c-di-GMP-specific phosphodiesterase class I)